MLDKLCPNKEDCLIEYDNIITCSDLLVSKLFQKPLSVLVVLVIIIYLSAKYIQIHSAILTRLTKCTSIYQRMYITVVLTSYPANVQNTSTLKIYYLILHLYSWERERLTFKSHVYQKSCQPMAKDHRIVIDHSYRVWLTVLAIAAINRVAECARPLSTKAL